MLLEMNGSSAGLPTVPTSADGLLKFRPGSMTLGLGRVIVRETEARATKSPISSAALAEGSQLSYPVSVKTKLTTFG